MLLAKSITATLEASLVLSASPPIQHIMFNTKVLCLARDIQQMKMAFFAKSTANLFLTLDFFDKNLRLASLLRPHPLKRLTAGAIKRNQKQYNLFSQLIRLHFT